MTIKETQMPIKEKPYAVIWVVVAGGILTVILLL